MSHTIPRECENRYCQACENAKLIMRLTDKVREQNADIAEKNILIGALRESLHKRSTP